MDNNLSMGEYKNTNIPYIGLIPRSWNGKKVRYLCKIKTGEKNTENKIRTGAYPFFVRSKIVENIDTYSYDGEAVLTSGDGAGVGEIYHYITGKFDYHQRVYKFSEFSDVTGRYFYYFLLSKFINVAILGSAKSTVDSLRLPLIKDFKIYFPERTEQERITRFLDLRIDQIENAIKKKVLLVNLLEEQKSIITQEAVTKGLNPRAKMKYSGVDWIGEIPKHWEVKRAKYLFHEVDERSTQGEEELLSVSHTTGVTPRSEKEVSMFLAESYAGSKLIKDGDLVYNIMWAWMGALGVSKHEGIVSPSYGVFRQRKYNFNPKYIESLLKSRIYVDYYNSTSTGLHSSRLRFYPHMFLNMCIAFPPLSEQNSIMKVVETTCGEIEESIKNTKKQIDNLNELKTTLIDSAVTGKINVSNYGH
ncbi:restriction endonuclease subunit S [Granulosicoccus sp. 3-233]|uniref:restriction endonuclease subunit S n=1 Tax=Granulosicoccus sp. 3-233 TaxID=3417969 RepID=UPI003D325954